MKSKSIMHHERTISSRSLLRVTSLLILLLSWSCDPEENDPGVGEVNFSAIINSQTSSGRIATNVAYQVVFSFSNFSGTIKQELRSLKILTMNGEFVTESLQLPVDNYSLREFFVTDVNNNILYAVPLKDSKMARFVRTPLPTPFTVRESQVTHVELEAIEITDESSPEDFGFAGFKLAVARVFKIWMTLVQNNVAVPAEVLIEGKNPEGEVVWSSVNQVDNAYTAVKIKSTQHHYTFTINANGISKQLSISEADLKANPYLIVGLGEADYYKYTTSDGNVTVHLPRDPTNPYCEIRVVDKTKVSYGYVSRSFWLNGQPVYDELYRSLESVVDNVTFKPFTRFRAGETT